MKLNALTFKTLNGSQYIFDNNKGVIIPFSNEMSYVLDNYDCSTREDIIHAGEKTHGFNREDDSPLFNFCR